MYFPPLLCPGKKRGPCCCVRRSCQNLRRGHFHLLLGALSHNLEEVCKHSSQQPREQLLRKTIEALVACGDKIYAAERTPAPQLPHLDDSQFGVSCSPLKRVNPDDSRLAGIYLWSQLFETTSDDLGSKLLFSQLKLTRRT